MLTEMDPTQGRLYDLLGLDAYAPRPGMTTTILPAAWAPLHAALRARRPVYHLLPRPPPDRLPPRPGPENKPAHGHRLQNRRTNQHRDAPRRPPDRDGGACTSTKSPTSLAGPKQQAQWATADNYNPAHPFPAIDHITIAVSCAVPQRTLGGPSQTQLGNTPSRFRENPR